MADYFFPAEADPSKDNDTCFLQPQDPQAAKEPEKEEGDTPAGGAASGKKPAPRKWFGFGTQRLPHLQLQSSGSRGDQMKPPEAKVAAKPPPPVQPIRPYTGRPDYAKKKSQPPEKEPQTAVNILLEGPPADAPSEIDFSIPIFAEEPDKRKEAPLHGGDSPAPPEQLLHLRRIGHPNVFGTDTHAVAAVAVQRPCTALPFAPPTPSPSSGDTARHQHPFRTAALKANAKAASAGYQARYQAKPRSPMDPNFRFLSPYMMGPHWSPRTASTFIVSKSPAKASILRTCSQQQPVPIHLIFDNLRKISKLGEGVFGEVFTGHFFDAPSSRPPRVYKVVPIEGDKRINQERQRRYGEIEPEIIVSRRLNILQQDEGAEHFTQGFARLTGALVCRGAYPRVLSSAWAKFAKEKGSENDVPEFGEAQEYVVLESELYGVDIESYVFKDAKHALALLIQVVHTLGVGETGVQFEHRDLHWGNILVEPTASSHIQFKINGEKLLVPSCGLKSTIIDFTIASANTCDPEGAPDGGYTFTDLSADEDQFNGDEDYQFEIYRMMRKELENDWSRFAPRNNIYWMHYLVDKLIRRGKYADKSSATHRKYLARLRHFKTLIPEFESCAHFALCYADETFLQIDPVEPH